MNANMPHRASGLPVTRNMPFVSASMPSRQQPRNMTGIYLGLEGNIRPPDSRGLVPPLARGRGISMKIRTPAEERRYHAQMEYERKKMVEILRIKEDKRGFTGQPVKKKANMAVRSAPPSRENSALGKRWGPAKKIDSSNVEDLIRTNPRRFTHIANSGLTRSENLTAWTNWVGEEGFGQVVRLPDHVVQSATVSDEMLGLEQCYKKVRKGNIETLHSFVPATAPQQHPASSQRTRRGKSAYATTTGFTVRSYRNPNQAEIVADFPAPKPRGRPQTVPIQRPHVPQPYFFQFYNQSKLVSANSGQHQRSRAPSEDLGHAVRIFAAPGAGVLSRTLQLQSVSLSEPDHHHSHKLFDSPPPTDRLQHRINGESKDLEVSMPTSANIALSEEKTTNLSLAAEPTETLPLTSIASEMETTKLDDGYVTGGGCESITADVLDCPDELLLVGRTLKSSSSGADITVGLEKEDGTADQVEIDDVDQGALEPVDESPKGNVRKASIVEKLVKTKQSEAIIAGLKETAEQRQKDFQKLLNEHAEIVQEIGRTASSENLISQAEHGERDH